LATITETVKGIQDKLAKLNVSVKYDNRDTHKPGWKFAEYELKGVPIRLAIGPRDIQNKTVELARRDTLTKMSVPLEGIDTTVVTLLDEIQANIYNKALIYREENTRKVDNYKDFIELLDTKGGFLSAHWDGTAETEAKIKEETKATIRCIPLNGELEEGTCIYSGKPSQQRVLFARAY